MRLVVLLARLQTNVAGWGWRQRRVPVVRDRDPHIVQVSIGRRLVMVVVVVLSVLGVAAAKVVGYIRGRGCGWLAAVVVLSRKRPASLAELEVVLRGEISSPEQSTTGGRPVVGTRDGRVGRDASRS